MADTQITPLGDITAPADWTLSDAQIVTIGSLFAHFDGSGAAGSFVPTVQIISDAGKTVLIVPQDTTIAAGASADASWASFLRTATTAAGPAASLKAIHLYDASAQTIVSGADARIHFATATSFDSTVFGTTLSGGNVVQIIAKKAGWYGLFADLDWASQPGAGYTEMQFLDPGDVQSSYAVSYSHPTSLHILPRPMISLVRYCPATTGFGDALPTKFELWIAQNSGANHNTSQVGWEMVYYGNSDF